MCGVTHTGDPTPAEFTDSARVPSVGFRCPDAMNDPPVSIPVVKLAYMAPSASNDALHFDTPDLPTPCSIPPLLPPPEPPPGADMPGTDHDGNERHTEYFPAGSIADETDITRPSSPSTPFEFPVNDDGAQYFDNVIAELPDIPSTMDSVTRIITSPRVCGLNGDARSRVQRASAGGDQRFSSMVDGGANICLTGTLSLLVDTIPISPMPISVAVEGTGASTADCCTKRGLLPLQMIDGGTYFQPCYYCENAVETIISPQAIVDASDTFVKWSQTGYKDDSPGTLRFYSASGLAGMTLTLTKRERVCVKQSGDRRSKLDRHDFTGIFLGYTASDHNIRYLDLDSGVVKSSHHAVFDEAWYMQPHRPPAA